MKSKLKLSFPYSVFLSENRRLGFSPKNGRMYAQDEYKHGKMALVMAISFAKAHQKAVFSPKERVWVDLKVYRPGNQSDASNFVKCINDAISQAIGVDDRYFDGSYQGFISENNPRFEIEIRQ